MKKTAYVFAAILAAYPVAAFAQEADAPADAEQTDAQPSAQSDQPADGKADLPVIGAKEAYTAPDGVVDAADPQSVVDALQSFGYKAQLTTDNEDDPLITSSTNGVDFDVYFYSCDDDHTGCENLLFNLVLDLPDGMTLEQANSWNYDKLLGKVSLDEDKDPVIDFFVTTANGGISRDNFEDAVEWWDYMVGEFEDFADF